MRRDISFPKCSPRDHTCRDGRGVPAQPKMGTAPNTDDGADKVGWDLSAPVESAVPPNEWALRRHYPRKANSKPIETG